ncbi:MAG: hypothetical protein JO361_01825 [Gammaproteobacteria bacterium]|nr:hypothetical protein [Gammaproteobacteria bacterium]
MVNPGTNSEIEGRRVLVIEDEMLVAIELESVLQCQGCTVLGPVATVDRALALIGGGQADAALLDLDLGGAVRAGSSGSAEQPGCALRGGERI